MSGVLGRLAPSPTGAQHVGNARTYLIAWLSARSQSGRLLLRIEDIDSPRIKPGADRQAEGDLTWLGLDWDEGPVWQTSRLAQYQAALDRLKQRELVYPCICSRKDIEEAASAPHLDHEPAPYPGTCAHHTVADAARLGDRPYCWRFRTLSPLPGFVDRVLGSVAPQPQHGGDFVVWKNTGTPAYQLAVVVDDAAQGVTEVVRGDDLVPSTPKQLALYQALGFTAPAFAHVPLVVGPDGRRLAKRHGDTRLSALRQHGVAPDALVGLLAWSCGWLREIRPISPEELLSEYQLDTLLRRPFVLTAELLAQIGYPA